MKADARTSGGSVATGQRVESFKGELLGHSPQMVRYLFKRFLLTLPAVWLVLTLVFLMIHIVPGDPVEQMLGEGAAPRQLSQLRHGLGLDLPPHTQYGHYLGRLCRADPGKTS